MASRGRAGQADATAARGRKRQQVCITHVLVTRYIIDVSINTIFVTNSSSCVTVTLQITICDQIIFIARPAAPRLLLRILRPAPPLPPRRLPIADL